MIVGDLIISIFLLGLSGYVYWMSVWVFPGNVGGIPGPGFFPSILAVVLAFFAIFLIICVTGKIRRGAGMAENPLKNWNNMLLTLVQIVVYLWLLPRLGFLWSTALWLAVALVWLKERQWVRTILVSVGMAGAILFVFGNLLNVLLPGR